MKKFILLIFIITKIYSQDWQKITNFERYPTGVIKVQENNKFQVGLPVKLKSNNNNYYYYYIITSVTQDALGNNFIFLNNTIPLTITEFYLGSENKVVVLFINQEDIDYTWDDDTAHLISIFGGVGDLNTDTVNTIIKVLKNNSNWITVNINSSRFNIDLPTNRYKVSRNENLNIKIDKKVKLYLRFVRE
jgi:hypothetical protein